jgi:hypothetical protein
MHILGTKNDLVTRKPAWASLKPSMPPSGESTLEPSSPTR